MTATSLLLWYFIIGHVLWIAATINRFPHIMKYAREYDPSPEELRSEVLKVLGLLYIFFAMLWPIATVTLAYLYFSGDLRPAEPLPPRLVFHPTQDHLKQLYSLEEIIEKETVYDPLGAAPEVPFGHLESVWQRFVAGLDPASALWSYEATWKCGSGLTWHREGYAEVRNDAIASFIDTIDRLKDSSAEVVDAA